MFQETNKKLTDESPIRRSGDHGFADRVMAAAREPTPQSAKQSATEDKYERSLRSMRSRQFNFVPP